MEGLRLVGLAQEDPRVPVTGAGAAAKFLLDALDRRYGLVARSGVDLSRAQKLAIAGATFHPNPERWRTRLHWHRRLSLEARSRNSARVLRGVDEPFDLVVQVFGLFHTRGAPYVLYLDNTVELSRRHWPEWVDVTGKELERLYDWERRLYGEALHVFAQGGPHADSVVEFYGVPRDRTSVVGAGANFDPLPELPRDRPREPIVLFVGGDWQRKGGDVLIEAFRALRERLPEARLQVVGTEDAPADEPGVEVLGRVGDRRRMAEIYASASVFCLPSRYDPYGLSIAEAMAYGLPCVITRVGALDEVAIEGETGLVVPPEDPVGLEAALRRLLEDPDLARRMGRAGRERVERHQNWDATVERMAPDLERAVRSAGGR